MKKYLIREEKECGCVVYSVINAITGNRVNYFPDYESAKGFVSHQERKNVLQELSKAVCGSERDIFTEEELNAFADHVVSCTDLTDGEEIADYLVVLFRDSKKDCRRCSVCGKLFKEGYVESFGHAYYCSDDCLHTKFTDEEWRRECRDDDQSYYTEFY